MAQALPLQGRGRGPTSDQQNNPPYHQIVAGVGVGDVAGVGLRILSVHSSVHASVHSSVHSSDVLSEPMTVALSGHLLGTVSVASLEP